MPTQIPKVTVQATDLWKMYKVGSIQYFALKGVSLSIQRGEFIAIVGPSGSGKTTLLNLFGALDKPTRGEVYLDGTPLSTLSDNALADIRSKKLGFVFQSYNLVPYLTAEQNVQLPLMTVGLSYSRRSEKARSTLAQFGLSNMLNKRPSEMSGGEQQRVVIARALVNDPSVILADEPTGNLDSKSGEAVATLLEEVSTVKNVTVIMVTHNMEMTKRCRRVIYLKDGTIEKEVAQAS